MAGREEYFEVISEINKWFLDYLCLTTWKNFKDSKQVTVGERDLIQGMLYLMGNEGVREEKQLFLVMLCRLTDGEDCDINYSENSNITVLEDMLTRFEELIKRQTKELMAEGEELIPVIKSEAVMVCCRAEEFGRAQEVCKRLWPKKDRKDRVYESMQELLRQKRTDNVFLKDYSYDDFLKTMITYLGKIHDSFTSPLIYEATKEVCKLTMEKAGVVVEQAGRGSGKGGGQIIQTVKGRCQVDCIQLAAKSLVQHRHSDVYRAEMNGAAENQSSNATTTQTVTQAVIHQSAENTGIPLPSPSRKLRKLWSNSSNQFFGVPTSPAKQNENTPKKLDVHDQERVETHKTASPDSQTTTRSSKPKQTKSTDDDGFLVPDTESPRRTRLTKRTLPDNDFKTPANPGPSKTSTPEERNAGSPAKYRKNINREDRHRPVETTTREDMSDIDDNISICTSVRSSHLKQMWTQEEMEDFYDAVVMLGVGNWAQIRDYLGTTRSSVKLKDKWRTMLKRGDVQELQDKRKKKTKK